MTAGLESARASRWLLLLLGLPLFAPACADDAADGASDSAASVSSASASGQGVGGAGGEAGAGTGGASGGSPGAGGVGQSSGGNSPGATGGAGGAAGGGAAGGGAAGGTGGAAPAEDCGDSADNDGDGAVDCADGDCVGSQSCAGAEQCTGLLDDDGDGDVDCADSDCDTAVTCPPVPAGWWCVHDRFNEHAYGVGNAGCDCDCGGHDPDCDLAPALPLVCYNASAKPGQICTAADQCTPPSAWTCIAALYDEMHHGGAAPACDCECGDGDPDCADWDLPITGCAPDEFCNVIGACMPEDPLPPPVPATWTCSPWSFAQHAQPSSLTYCDCGCGAHDPDCDLDHYGLVCDGFFPIPFTTCVADVCVEPQWTCDPALFDEGGQGLPSPSCDCACGVADPDCVGLAPVSGCAPGEGCNNASCVPTSWACSHGYWHDQECDCGCGAVDVDCADATAGSCDYCLMGGSCGNGVCPANIDPTNNSTCL